MSQERKYDTAAMRKWMKDNVSDFVDECDEVNCTAMVEAWDTQCSTGLETLDMNHPAWDIAVDISDIFLKTKG